MINKDDYKAIVIGASAGGMSALSKIIPKLPAAFPLPIIVVIHLPADSTVFFGFYLNKDSKINVKEADEKEPAKAGYVYFAPPNYHLLMEDDETFSLSIDPKVNYSRPSIDVLFESAARVYQSKLIGIILTGANKDGAYGIKKIKEYGGLTIVQDPEEAESNAMPLAAMTDCKIDFVLSLKKIANLINTITGE